VTWHPSQSIFFDSGAGGDGETIPAEAGKPLTVDDVGFSWLYHQAQFGWSYSSCYQIKEVQTKNGPPTYPAPVGSFPYPALTTPGGLTATWTANATLGTDEIYAKMDVQAYLANHWIGGVYILPSYIWQHVTDAYAFDSVAANAEIGSGPYKWQSMVTGESVTLAANRNYFLSTGSGTFTDNTKEMYHRRGDAGSGGGSGPNAYDGKVDGFDLAYFAAAFSATPYADKAMPAYWRDDVYTGITYTGSGGISTQTGISVPFDGTGQESANGITWGATTDYPWRVKNPGAGPAYLYVDFNYDHKADGLDLAILGAFIGTDAGSGW